MFWILLAAAQPSYPHCGGIPGGMYDAVHRNAEGLSLTMHRYTADDASGINLAAAFFGASGVIRRWRGDHSPPTWDATTHSWIHTVVLEIPEGAQRVSLFDLHYERTCEVELTDPVRITAVHRTKKRARRELKPTDTLEEDLPDEAIAVSRGDRAEVVKRELTIAPEDLERRAALLAKLKRTLPRMPLESVLSWMEHQGFRPDDPDVLEMLGDDWLEKKKLSR